ncbi:MAG: hypothetical protein JXA42_22565 [Anaerolineales bacterium]|nr:hypothetical protein [Anaerolineales bacterium]
MNQFVKTITFNASSLLADVGIFILYLLLLPPLKTLFQLKSTGAGLIIGGIYLLFCFAVYLIRRQPGATGVDSPYSRELLGFLGVIFGIMVVYMMVDGSGMINKLDTVDTGNMSNLAYIGILLGSLIGLALAFLYTIIVVIDVPPAGQRQFWTELVSLLGVNLMILTTVAFWQATFHDTEPYEDLALGGKLLIFVLTYLFFLLFFAPPRMLFLLNKPSLVSVVTFVLQTGYFVWDSVSRFAWR